MKTAEEYTENSGMACEYGYSVKVMPVCDVLIVMKQYAKRVAEQALKDACENAYYTDNSYHQDAEVELDKESILNTEIKLP